MNLVRRNKRLAELTALGAQHDLGFLLDRIGLSAWVPQAFRSSDPAAGGLSDAERVRRLFEALGPTFVKMGQILSTRPDLIPRAFIDELERLQDHVQTVPFPAMRAIAEEELGQPLWGAATRSGREAR